MLNISSDCCCAFDEWMVEMERHHHHHHCHSWNHPWNFHHSLCHLPLCPLLHICPLDVVEHHHYHLQEWHQQVHGVQWSRQSLLCSWYSSISVPICHQTFLLILLQKYFGNISWSLPSFMWKFVHFGSNSVNLYTFWNEETGEKDSRWEACGWRNVESKKQLSNNRWWWWWSYWQMIGSKRCLSGVLKWMNHQRWSPLIHDKLIKNYL